MIVLWFPKCANTTMDTLCFAYPLVFAVCNLKLVCFLTFLVLNKVLWPETFTLFLFHKCSLTTWVFWFISWWNCSSTDDSLLSLINTISLQITKSKISLLSDDSMYYSKKLTCILLKQIILILSSLCPINMKINFIHNYCHIFP